jgi:hypothetical protein
MSETTDHTTSTDTTSGPLRIDSPAGLLAVVLHLLGFVPQDSLVVIGTESAHGPVKLTLRYDLPDPPGRGASAEIAGHATAVLAGAPDPARRRRRLRPRTPGHSAR